MLTIQQVKKLHSMLQLAQQQLEDLTELHEHLTNELHYDIGVYVNTHNYSAVLLPTSNDRVAIAAIVGKSKERIARRIERILDGLGSVVPIPKDGEAWED